MYVMAAGDLVMFCKEVLLPLSVAVVPRSVVRVFHQFGGS
jgi:hypothetical protein